MNDEQEVLEIALRALRLEKDDGSLADAVKVGIDYGRTRYGKLHLDKDPRNFVEETRAELRDAVVYLSIEILRRTREGEKTGALYDALVEVCRAWACLQ